MALATTPALRVLMQEAFLADMKVGRLSKLAVGHCIHEMLAASHGWGWRRCRPRTGDMVQMLDDLGIVPGVYEAADGDPPKVFRWVG